VGVLATGVQDELSGKEERDEILCLCQGVQDWLKERGKVGVLLVGMQYELSC